MEASMEFPKEDSTKASGRLNRLSVDASVEAFTEASVDVISMESSTGASTEASVEATFAEVLTKSSIETSGKAVFMEASIASMEASPMEAAFKKEAIFVEAFVEFFMEAAFISSTTFKLLLHNDHALGHFLLCPPPRYAVYTFRQLKRAGMPGAFVNIVMKRVRTHDEVDANGLLNQVASGHT